MRHNRSEEIERYEAAKESPDQHCASGLYSLWVDQQTLIGGGLIVWFYCEKAGEIQAFIAG